ncbi:rhomboid family intramembrane serine protease [Flavobacterium sp. KACC 22761]|uniref:rhomboid family intramembrane serine protease n=1 Tax=Flavobacterium sp. KACC 22761 TaxID=3092665 RepID=UPI002A75CE87|nr:rhomboid family intramembrane serine protease [Flavobacterium sp. KACC 22761]WPO77262.1 rhomboid family intramembrane serine protease [Flavobacterium sp. KACC 22761]
MAFGFPAKYSELIPLNNLSHTTFILHAISICKKLNWNIVSVDENHLKAFSQNNKNTWNEIILIDFDENTAKITSSSNGNQIYDRSRNKKNAVSFLDLYFEELNSVSNSETDEVKVQEQIKIARENTVSKENSSHKNISRFYSVFSIFIPTKDYLFTPILIYLNLLIFIIMTYSGVNFFKPSPQNIIDWGGNYGPMIYENEWWRLLSCRFVHNGFLHLLISCFSLAYIGLLLESYLKRWQFLATYLLCGIIASLSSLCWNKDFVSSGAASAFFGLYGILIVLFLFKRTSIKVNLRIILSIIILLVLNLAYNFIHEINSVAEIASFASGIIFGLAISLANKKKEYGFAFASTVATIIIVFLFINFKNSKVYIYQVMEYEKRMQEFTDMEKMALEAYSSYYGGSFEESRDNALYMIKDRGIYYWNENITLITELDKLYLPKEIHEHNNKLIEYCKLRISLYELAYKKIAEQSTLYDEQMLALNFQIQSIMNKIKKAQTPN